MTRAELIRQRRLTPAPRQAASGPFRTFGEQLAAVARAGERPGQPDPRLLSIQERAPAGGSELVPSDGGFLVQVEFSQQLLSRLYSQGSLLSRMTKFTTVSSNSIKVPGVDEQSRADGSRWGGILSYWQNEADALKATKPKFRLVEFVAKKLTGLCYATDEALADSSVLETAITLALTNEFQFQLERCALFGSGAGQPLGILNAGACITVDKEVLQSNATANSANIAAMMDRLWPPSFGRAIWVVNGALRSQLEKLVIGIGTSGGSQLPLYHYRENDDDLDRLCGIPVTYSEYSSAAGSLGDLVLADFSQYGVFDRIGGIDAAVSIHVLFESDQQVFRFVMRVDGQPLWHTAITPFGGGDTLGPYVALAARP